MNKKTADEVLELEDVLEIFGNIDDEVGLLDTIKSKKRKETKSWNSRPECWMDIAKHHEEFGLQQTLIVFENELSYLTDRKSREKTVQRWVIDRRNKRKLSYSHRASHSSVICTSRMY